MLSQIDQDRIAAAVAEAEANTSAEVVCVVAGSVSDASEAPIAWAAGAALIVPLIAAYAGLNFERLAQPAASWSVGGVQPGAILGGYAALQAVVFALVWALARLVSRESKARRVRDAARRHYAEARGRLEADRPLVVIFAALADRRMEIVSDPLAEQRLGRRVWDRAITEALAEIAREGPAAGLSRAVAVCGAALAEAFPDDGAANAYPDAPVLLN